MATRPPPIRFRADDKPALTCLCTAFLDIQPLNGKGRKAKWCEVAAVVLTQHNLTITGQGAAECLKREVGKWWAKFSGDRETKDSGNHDGSDERDTEHDKLVHDIYLCFEQEKEGKEAKGKDKETKTAEAAVVKDLVGMALSVAMVRCKPGARRASKSTSHGGDVDDDAPDLDWNLDEKDKDTPIANVDDASDSDIECTGNQPASAASVASATDEAAAKPAKKKRKKSSASSVGDSVEERAPPIKASLANYLGGRSEAKNMELKITVEFNYSTFQLK
ncbi:hypothetical protein M885DRAFT_501343 [Pelagophyceae sp. CCMP2097]|nr:hypothetical protein M885DRAFT_501343 [Pelagophyceae sp. CCMP2097]